MDRILTKLLQLIPISGLALSFAACTTLSTTHRTAELIPGDPSAPSQVTPSEALAAAEKYARHRWKPFARNILHGKDPMGVRVDTPDIGYRPSDGRNGWWMPGEYNEGIPYKWGGFDSVSGFDAGISMGLAAGDVSTPAKRRLDNAAVSQHAVGLDCSGYVSRCLKLPKPYDTSMLPAICTPLTNPHDLQPGDLFNIPKRHVMLFAGWAKPDKSWVYYYETGGIPDWKPGLKASPLLALLDLGFQPLRYNGMAREAIPTDKEVLTRSAKARAHLVPKPELWTH